MLYARKGAKTLPGIG